MARKETGNDSTILALTAQIKDKKAALAGIKKFSPKTNCSLVMNGERFNLQAASPEVLTLLLVKINALLMSSADLKVGEVEMQGYPLSAWAEDIKNKLLVSTRAREEARLKILEEKLTDLLSADKKTELIISELKDLI